MINIFESPDIFCMNETRVSVEYLEKNKILETHFSEYYSYWNTSIGRKGYSGVSIVSKIKPICCKYGIGDKNIDLEGRVVTLEFPEFYLVAVYVPNSGEGLKRLTYRLEEWDMNLQKYLKRLRTIKKVIVCGDFNCAHQEIDIYDSENKHNQPGFTLEERNSFSNLLNLGYTDSFRTFYPKKQEFTFWANRAFSRPVNKGWRIDYFLNDTRLIDRVKDCQILTKFTGSDHCPIKLILH